MKRFVSLCALVVGMTACTSSPSSTTESSTVTLLAYDAFTPQEGIFDSFTRDTGITVKVVTGGDSGTVVSKAILTSGNPEGDVLWGVDNTALSRAQEAKLLTSYEPVDEGDVCINIHDDWFASRGIAAPTSLEDLIKPAYKNLLVVEDPANSSPGLAFLMATIARFGDSWTTYWKSLVANGVKIVNDWTTAYTIDFSGSSGRGDRPLVVSYGSSPPAEVVFSDPPITDPPTSVMVDSCFRQVEYVGALRGTKNPTNAAKLVDFLLGKTFQESMPLSLFVFPTNEQARLPEVFERFAVRASDPLTIDPSTIASNRTAWLSTWQTIVD